MENTPLQLNTIYADVLFPWTRTGKVYALSELCNKTYQTEKWEDFWSEAYSCFEELGFDYDDLNFKDFENAIGTWYLNTDEAVKLYELYKSFKLVTNNIGKGKEKSDYLSSQLWDNLVLHSSNALDIFLKNEKKSSKACVYPWRLGNDPDEWLRNKT